eukprot:4068692-Alexandrium_andersonii.AAC.1
MPVYSSGFSFAAGLPERSSIKWLIAVAEAVAASRSVHGLGRDVLDHAVLVCHLAYVGRHLVRLRLHSGGAIRDGEIFGDVASF